MQSIKLLWTPPADKDYAYSEVWASGTANDLLTAGMVGTGVHGFVHGGLGATQTWYYWIRAVDTSGNRSVSFHPPGPTTTVTATTGQIDSTYIESLVADKIATGTLISTVLIGVGTTMVLDGVNSRIYILDKQVPPPCALFSGV